MTHAKSLALLLLLSLAAIAPVRAAAPQADAKAEEVLNAARSALGGGDALAKVQSATVTGSTRLMMGEREFSSDVTLDILLPDKFKRTEEMSFGQGGPSVTRVSAVNGSEVWDVDLSVVHITRLDGRAGRREAGVKQHRGMLTEEQIWERDGVCVVSPARSIVEVTTEQDVEHSLVVANSLLHLKKTSVDLVAAEAIRCDRWPDSLATRIVVALADPRIESVGETRTAHVIWSQRLPKFEPQYKIRDHSGQVIARVDFAAPTLGVFLEFDGRLKYVQGQQGKTLDELLLEERRRV